MGKEGSERLSCEDVTQGVRALFLSLSSSLSLCMCLCVRSQRDISSPLPTLFCIFKSQEIAAFQGLRSLRCKDSEVSTPMAVWGPL